jgi:hypothetical protein
VFDERIEEPFPESQSPNFSLYLYIVSGSGYDSICVVFVQLEEALDDELLSIACDKLPKESLATL